MKRLLIAIALVMLVLPAAAWANGTPPDTSFDAPYTDNIATGWTAYNDYAWCPGVQVDHGAVLGRTGTGLAQALYTAGEGGVYGQFDAMPDMNYEIGVWMSGDFTPDIPRAFVGIDWTGGTDCNSGNIVWAANSEPNTWQHIVFKGTAAAPKITMFLDAYAGYSVYDDITGIGSPAAVPEPGSCLALCSGLIGLVGIIRRKK